MLFYALFGRSGYLPRRIAVWGIIAAPLAMVGVVGLFLGYEVPMVVFLPNLPFALGIGVWLLIKELSTTHAPPELARAVRSPATPLPPPRSHRRPGCA